MKAHYNKLCYLHDVAYVDGGAEYKRWLADVSFCWGVLTEPVPPLVRVGGAAIALIALPALLLGGWYKWHKIKIVGFKIRF